MLTEKKTVMSDLFQQELQLEPRWKQKDTKQRQRRICTERRKAQSRVAARSRREKESHLFREIAALLPLAPYEEAQLDKASVIRITIAYLHLRSLLVAPHSTTVAATTHPVSAVRNACGVDAAWVNNSFQNKMLAESNEKWFLDCAVDGFLLVITLNGKIIFTTQDFIPNQILEWNCWRTCRDVDFKKIWSGLLIFFQSFRMDVIGQSLFDFMHPSDHKEIKELLTRMIKSQEEQRCELFLRIKGAVKNTPTPWRVFHCTGLKKSSSTTGLSYLLLLCRPLPVQEVIQMETCMNLKAFLSIHGPDLKFTYCHSGVLELIGFSDIELYGQSMYQYCHPSDCQLILKAHLCLFSKGQVYTGKYRLLQKHGGYVWVETDAAVVYCIRTAKPESIVCINYILSGVELPDVVFSLEQTKSLLNPQDYALPQLQSIPPPLTTTTKKTSQATADKNRSSVSNQSDKDGEAKVCTEIQNKADDSPPFDIGDQDLDSLAPYIPMHEEDFLLTPVFGGGAEHSELNTHRPLPLKPEQHSPMETDFPAKRSLRSAVQHSESFTSTYRLNMRTGLTSSRHNSLDSVTTQRQVQCNSQISFHQNRTDRWRTNRADVSQLTDTFLKTFDGPPASCQSRPAAVPLALKYAKLSWCPPGSSSEHTNQHREDKTNSAVMSLPVLSRWDCEVNAPLGPTSRLLQGTELTTVLDQVASRVSWY